MLLAPNLQTIHRPTSHQIFFAFQVVNGRRQEDRFASIRTTCLDRLARGYYGQTGTTTFPLHLEESRPQGDPPRAVEREATARHAHVDVGTVCERRAPGTAPVPLHQLNPTTSGTRITSRRNATKEKLKIVTTTASATLSRIADPSGYGGVSPAAVDPRPLKKSAVQRLWPSSICYRSKQHGSVDYESAWSE